MGKNERLTRTIEDTKSKGNPYRSTVSTKTRKTKTWIQTITASLQLVRPSRIVSPHSLRSSPPTRSTSFASSSRPPSMYLKSRGIHLFSLALWVNSALCFLNVVTAYRLNSSSSATRLADRGTTIGDIVSYSFKKSLICWDGTAIRCVSKYSESWTSFWGSTIDARDLDARFPLREGES